MNSQLMESKCSQNDSGQYKLNSTISTTPPVSSLQSYQRSLGNQAVSLLGLYNIQAKLYIGQQNDKYEQEADRVADQVMMGAVHDQENTSVNVMLQKTHDGHSHPAVASKGFTKSLQSLSHTGRALTQSDRNYFEPRFGYDFSQVRIHADKTAAQSAQSIDALAYTHGNRIVFNEGAYQPDTLRGKKLLAHELTHVVQQNATQEVRRQSPGRQPQGIEQPGFLSHKNNDSVRHDFHLQAFTKARDIGGFHTDKSNISPAKVGTGPVEYCSIAKNHRDLNQAVADGASRKLKPLQHPELIQHTPLDEESRLQNPTARGFITGSALSTYVQQLTQALSSVPSLVRTQAVVDWWGYKLWEHARVIAQQQNNTDDRPLYWTRLQMRQVIRNFNPSARFTITAAEREQLIAGFESSSRGMPTGTGNLRWIDDVKKILISGFDPFQLDRNISQDNPSGAAVLALDGKIVRHPRQRGLRGQIQGVILPVNFRYFDQGNIERFFQSYIQGSNPVDMVMTISQGGSLHELEEFGSRFREPGYTDNERESGGAAILPGGAEFTRSTLPRATMRNEVLGRQSPISDETAFEGIDQQGNAIAGPSLAHPDPGQLATATRGPAGVYLSNEVFYRTTLLRDASSNQSRRTLPVGHLHIPKVATYARQHNLSNSGARDEIINTIERLIIAALPSI